MKLRLSFFVALFFGGFSAYGHPVTPTQFAEKAVYPHGIISCPSVKNQLGIFVWAHFWILCSLSLIFVSIPPPLPHSLH